MRPFNAARAFPLAKAWRTPLEKPSSEQAHIQAHIPVLKIVEAPERDDDAPPTEVSLKRRLPPCCARASKSIANTSRRIVKIWRTPIEKAGEEDVDWLLELATKLEPIVGAAFIDAVLNLRNSPDSKRLRDALEARDVKRVLAALGDANLQAQILSRVVDPLGYLVTAGADGGLNAASLTMTFDLSNPEAIRAVRSYGFDLIRQITDDTRAGIRQIVGDAIAFGGHPYEQARQIRSLIGLTDSQAQAVANFRRFLQEGDRAALTRELRDRRFDPTLERALGDNQTVDLAPEQIDTMVGRYASRMLDFRAKNIARTECLTADTLVDAAMVSAVFRRWYEGDIVEIVAADGAKFTATPNHPMLTRRGWVSAGQVCEGDDLVCDGRKQNASPAGNENIEDRPATISEIFDTLSAIWITKRKHTGKPDFHGDGMDGYVDVLGPDGPLEIGNFAPLFKPTVENFLSPSGVVRSTFCRYCSRLLSVDKQPCCCRTAAVNASSSQAPLDQIRINAEALGNLQLRLSSDVSGCDVVSAQIGAEARRETASGMEGFASLGEGSRNPGSGDNISDTIRTDADFRRNLSDAEAAGIKLKRVVFVERRKFSGHVFNLSTPFGYFCIGGGAYSGNTINALNLGQQLGWRQARDNGLIDDSARRFWIVTPDDRLCPECAAVPGMNPDGVGLDEEFDTPYGPMEGPTLHPQCRCTEIMRTGAVKLDTRPGWSKPANRRKPSQWILLGLGDRFGKYDPAMVVQKDFDPDEPRDDHGEWTSDGAPSRPISRAEDKALWAYRTGGYEAINKTLDGRPLEEGDEDSVFLRESGGVKKSIKGIDAVMSRSTLSKETTVYRGLVNMDGQESRAVAGSRLTFGKYLSTSRSETEAASRAAAVEEGQRGWVMKITMPVGAHAIDVASAQLTPSSFDREKEVLLPHGLTFEVTKVDAAKRYLEVKYVG